METTMLHWGNIGVILGLWKDGNYYNGLYRVYIGVILG